MLYDWENTTIEIRAAKPEVALLPISAVEQHGDHLPVGTKVLILDVIARRVAEHLPGSVYLLPTLPVGVSDLHLGTPGTIAISWKTMTLVVNDLIESLLSQGIRKVAVLVGLGDASVGRVRPSENYIVKTAVRQLNYDHPELQAIWVQPFSIAAEELKAICQTATEEVQAGEVVTSVMMYLSPDLVKGRGKDSVPLSGRKFLNYTPFVALCPGGVWGFPSLASPDKGARVLEAVVQQTVNYLVETFEQLSLLKG